MALDAVGERVMVVYREPAALAVLDARDGKTIVRVEILRRRRRRLLRYQAPARVHQLRRRASSMSSNGRATRMQACRASAPYPARAPLFSCPSSTGSSWPSGRAAETVRRSVGTGRSPTPIAVAPCRPGPPACRPQKRAAEAALSLKRRPEHQVALGPDARASPRAPAGALAGILEGLVRRADPDGAKRYPGSEPERHGRQVPPKAGGRSRPSRAGLA